MNIEQVSLDDLPAAGLVIKVVGDIYLDIFYFSRGWSIDETISFIGRCKVSTYVIIIYYLVEIFKNFESPSIDSSK